MTSSPASLPACRFAKGDVVLLATDWNRTGVVLVQRLTVGSWGKRQGHLLHADGTLGVRFYADYVPHMERESAIPNVTDWALAFGRQVLEQQRAHLEECLSHYPNADHFYVAYIQKGLVALLQTPVLLVTGNLKGQVTVFPPAAR